jgi:hypothetical protein
MTSGTKPVDYDPGARQHLTAYARHSAHNLDGAAGAGRRFWDFFALINHEVGLSAALLPNDQSREELQFIGHALPVRGESKTRIGLAMGNDGGNPLVEREPHPHSSVFIFGRPPRLRLPKPPSTRRRRGARFEKHEATLTSEKFLVNKK